MKKFMFRVLVVVAVIAYVCVGALYFEFGDNTLWHYNEVRLLWVWILGIYFGAIMCYMFEKNIFTLNIKDIEE